MNPNKKREALKRIKNAYRQYTLDILDYNKRLMDIGSCNINKSQTPEEYYDSQAVTPLLIKPDIRNYLNKEDGRVLKKILLKKRGYEDIKLN